MLGHASLAAGAGVVETEGGWVCLKRISHPHPDPLPRKNVGEGDRKGLSHEGIWEREATKDGGKGDKIQIC